MLAAVMRACGSVIHFESQEYGEGICSKKSDFKEANHVQHGGAKEVSISQLGNLI